jgi:hypothetical protein
VAEAGDVAEEVTGAEEAWVAEAGDAEAGVAEAGATEVLSAEAGATGAGLTGAGAIDALFVEAGVAGGLSMAMVTGVVARTDIAGAIAGVVFPSMATDTARPS